MHWDCIDLLILIFRLIAFFVFHTFLFQSFHSYNFLPPSLLSQVWISNPNSFIVSSHRLLFACWLIRQMMKKKRRIMQREREDSNEWNWWLHVFSVMHQWNSIHTLSFLFLCRHCREKFFLKQIQHIFGVIFHGSGNYGTKKYISKMISKYGCLIIFKKTSNDDDSFNNFFV